MTTPFLRSPLLHPAIPYPRLLSPCQPTSVSYVPQASSEPRAGGSATINRYATEQYKGRTLVHPPRPSVVYNENTAVCLLTTCMQINLLLRHYWLSQSTLAPVALLELRWLGAGLGHTPRSGEGMGRVKPEEHVQAQDNPGVWWPRVASPPPHDAGDSTPKPSCPVSLLGPAQRQRHRPTPCTPRTA